jgi:hypothetical protein
MVPRAAPKPEDGKGICKPTDQRNEKPAGILSGVGKREAHLMMKSRSMPVSSLKLICDLKAAHLKLFKSLYPEMNREKERQFVSAKMAAAPWRSGAQRLERASQCGHS